MALSLIMFWERPHMLARNDARPTEVLQGAGLSALQGKSAIKSNEMARRNMTAPENRNSGHTLKEVISIIPDACYSNPTRRAIPYLIWAVVLYGLSILGLLSTDNPLLVAPLWLLAGLSISGLFILGHDACHGALFKSEKLCRLLGRILMLPSWHVYSAWDMGHNRVHHVFTTKEHRDFVWHPLTQGEYNRLSRWQKTLHRIEWSAFGAGLYYLVEVWWKKMVRLRPVNKLAQSIKEDKRFVLYFLLLTVVVALMLGWIVGSTALYALWIWIKLIAVPWLVFNHAIGATVYIHHIHPNIPWHADGLWSKFKGQVIGTTNIHIPAPLNVFFHNIFIHIPHHVDPRIPFYHLPAAAQAIKDHYREFVHDQPFRLWDYLRVTRRCKLYDFEKSVWLDYQGRPAVVLI